MAGKGRSVEFRIRAKDEASSVLKQIEKNLKGLSGAEFVKRSAGELARMREELRKLEAQTRAAQANIGMVAKVDASGVARAKREFLQLRQAVQETSNAIQNLETKRRTERIGAAASIREAFEERNRQSQAAWAANLQQQTAAARQALGYQEELADAIDHTTTKLERQAKVVQGGGTLTKMRGGLAEREIAAISTAKGRGLLGLRPYELTNLTYQVNDLVSGVAMGQPPMQVFMQQIGQIAQLFPNVVAGILKFAVSLKGAFVAALVVGALRAKSLNDTLKELDKTLTLNADGSRYNLEALAQMVDKYDRLGMSVTEARSAVQQFIKAGADAGRIDGLMKLALGYSKATGMKQGDATKAIAEAFGGGVNKVRELDKELNFLTASQYKHIMSLKEAGRETEAVTESQRILQGKFDEINAKANGPWSRAFKSLASAFNTLADAMADSAFLRVFGAGFERIAQVIETGANDLERFVRLLGRIKNNGVELWTGAAQGSNAEKIVSNNQRIGNLRSQIDSARISDPLNQSEMYGNIIKEAQEEINRLTQENLKLFGEMNTKMETSAEKSEKIKKNYDDARNLISERLDKLQQEADLADETARERFIQQGIEEAIADAKERGLIADEKSAEAMGLMATLRDRLGFIFDTKQSAEFTSGDGGAIGNFVDKVIGVESGGNARAKNPNSTATGLGQFIESTWLSMFKKYFPDRAEGMSRAAILALRNDAEISRKMIELYAKENADQIKSIGANVTEGRLYLAHFLGPQGAKNILRADPSTPVNQVLEPGQIKANRSILEGKTAGDVLAWAERKMGVSKQEVEVATKLAERDAERAKTAEDLAKSTDARIATEKEGAKYAAMSERAAYIEKTIQDEINRYSQEGLTIEQAKVEELRKAAAAKWDAENADKVAMADYERLLELRGSLMTQFGVAEQTGDQGAMNDLAAQITSIDQQLRAASASAISFWQSVGGPDSEVQIAKIKATMVGLEKVNTELFKARELNEQLSQAGSQAWTTMNQAIANGENAADAFFNALRQGIAQFVIDITSAIAKQMIFNAISGGGEGGSGGLIATAANWFLKKHDGGIVGSGSSQRGYVNPAMFAAAVRYHTGGIAGLKPNEVPAILKRGEEVLTDSDPRHINNGGGSANVTIKQVNVLDPAEIISRALADEEGQRVMVNWMSRNRHRVSNALG